MNPEFFQVGLVIIAFAHVVAVNARAADSCTVQLSDGNSYTFEGDEAKSVIQAFVSREDRLAAAPAGDVPLA